MGFNARYTFFVICFAFSIDCLPLDEIAEYSEPFQESIDQNAEESETHAVEILPPNNEEISQSNDNPTILEQEGRSQNFFPSFANFFEPRQGVRFPGYSNQETAFSQRPSSYRTILNNYPIFGNYRNVDGFSGKQSSAALVDATNSILGSGNFGVIKGGTFASQSEGEDYNDGYNFYNNGHGRPSLSIGYIANPRPNYNQDQFANFRDFADINTPSNTAYSEFFVVYANKNGTIASPSSTKDNSEPKNIIETLNLLDENPDAEVLKLSKFKAKLAKTVLTDIKKRNRKLQSKHLSDSEEPLLALS